MELIDIIITTLSIVLLVLVIILLVSFIVYKTRSKNHFLLLQDNYMEAGIEITKRMHDVVKPKKPQRYKVVNENINLASSTNRKERVKINSRYVLYNYIRVNEIPLNSREKYTKWSD